MALGCSENLHNEHFRSNLNTHATEYKMLRFSTWLSFWIFCYTTVTFKFKCRINFLIDNNRGIVLAMTLGIQRCIVHQLHQWLWYDWVFTRMYLYIMIQCHRHNRDCASYDLANFIKSTTCSSKLCLNFPNLFLY